MTAPMRIAFRSLSTAMWHAVPCPPRLALPRQPPSELALTLAALLGLSTAPLLADMAPSSTAYTPTLPHLSVPPTSSPVLPQSPHAALLREVADADLHALSTLSALAADLDNHSSLLRAGAAVALTAALEKSRREPPAPAAALRVNLLRILADLSASQQAHVFFVEAGVVPLLTELLRLYPPPTVKTGWLPWLLAPFGLGAPTLPDVTPQPSDAPDDLFSVADALAVGTVPPLMPQVDLAAGISYHTVRCISNLARNSDMHTDLLSAGVLPLLMDALKATEVTEGADQERTELLRCTVLSVAALSKSAPVEVVSGGGHMRLIHFMLQTIDSVAQMYAAGGVRNLARHWPNSEKCTWKVHRELVVSGAAEALKAGMESKSNPQTKLFAALAFGDLMTTGHHKADIIRRRLEPVFVPFAHLLREKNLGVARSVHRTLMSLFADMDGGSDTHLPVGTIVPPKLARAMAEECGQLVNGAVARGDVGALKAVRCMCGDSVVAQGMVDKGLLEVLTRGATKGKGEYWEESVAALSLLSGWSQFVPLLDSRGALRAVLQRPCLEHEGRWSAAFFANMARSDEHHAEIAYGALPVLLLALTAKDNDNARQEGARGLYNLSLGGVSRVMIGQGGALLPLVATISSTIGDTRRYAIGALAKISEAYEHATKLIEADVVSVLLKAAKEDPRAAKDVALCLSHLSQVVEVHGSLARSGAVNWFVEMVSRNGGRGEDASEVLQYATIGICNVAYSAGVTRTVLRDAGAVRILTALSSSGMSAPQVVYSARQALSNLKGVEKPGMLPIDAASRPAAPA